jgi:hypothetical protein
MTCHTRQHTPITSAMAIILTPFRTRQHTSTECRTQPFVRERLGIHNETLFHTRRRILTSSRTATMLMQCITQQRTSILEGRDTFHTRPRTSIAFVTGIILTSFRTRRPTLIAGSCCYRASHTTIQKGGPFGLPLFLRSQLYRSLHLKRRAAKFLDQTEDLSHDSVR